MKPCISHYKNPNSDTLDVRVQYAALTLGQCTPLSAYYATGAHLSVTSGRIAFTFGLRGPALSIDTGETPAAPSMWL